MKNRLLTTVLATVLALCAWAAGNVNWTGNVAAWTQGSGTLADPYLIENGEHLAYLAEQVNGGNDYSGVYFKLANNIDLLHKPWIAIGDKMDNPFKGHFDGAEYSVFNVKPTTSSYIGLFGVLDGAEITNLYINSDIKL